MAHRPTRKNTSEQVETPVAQNKDPVPGPQGLEPNHDFVQEEGVSPVPVEEIKVVPLKPNKFGLASAKILMYDASVPGNTPKQVLLDGRYWAHVSRQLQIGAEIRVLADDLSFRALLVVTYVRATEVRVSLAHYAKLETVDYDAIDNVQSGFKVSLRGTLGWCIVKESTGELVKQDLPNQQTAQKFLGDYLKAMAA